MITFRLLVIIDNQRKKIKNIIFSDVTKVLKQKKPDAISNLLLLKLITNLSKLLGTV